MRRFVLLAAVLTLLAPAPAEAAKPAHSWAQAEIKLVVSRGLMADSVGTFKPNAPLTQKALSDLVSGLTEDEPQGGGTAIDRAGDDRTARCPARSSAGAR